LIQNIWKIEADENTILGGKHNGKNEKSKKIYDDFGEMLFTHFGVSGPIILSGSAHLLRYKDIDRLLKESKIKLVIDLKPALSEEELDKRIIRDFEEFKNLYNKCKNEFCEFCMEYTETEYGKIEFGVFDLDKNIILVSFEKN